MASLINGDTSVLNGSIAGNNLAAFKVIEGEQVKTFQKTRQTLPQILYQTKFYGKEWKSSPNSRLKNYQVENTHETVRINSDLLAHKFIFNSQEGANFANTFEGSNMMNSEMMITGESDMNNNP